MTAARTSSVHPGQLVRTRMAPSPTGEYHVGHIATLLKNYAFAKRHGGQFVLRIEDTDQERKVEGAVERILQVIRDYGLSWDEGPEVGGPYGPYTQSEKLPVYGEAAQQLVASGHAYYCFCTKERLDEVREAQRQRQEPPKYDRYCRSLSSEAVQERLAAGESSVIRLKVPDAQPIQFTDLMRGVIEVNSESVDDQVLLKSDGFPTYHLGVVVDDHHMNITHILRGEEWISSTPKHMLLYQAFGWEPPVYAHIPIFLNPDGKGKMSKRKGTVSARSFLENGYLPEAMLNFFMILGWSPADEREILTLEEYIAEFDPANISTKSVAFDIEKLRWLNGIYIRNLSESELIRRLQPYVPAEMSEELFTLTLPLVRERLVTLADFPLLTSFFYQETIAINESELLKQSGAAEVDEQLEATIRVLGDLTEWHHVQIEAVLRELQEAHAWKKRQYFMMLRQAITGQTATPPLFDIFEVIGKELSLKRLALAQQVARSHTSHV